MTRTVRMGEAIRGEPAPSERLTHDAESDTEIAARTEQPPRREPVGWRR